VLRHSGLDPESPDRSEKILNQVQEKNPEPGTRNPELYLVEDMVEKPDPSEAPSNLAIIGRYILIPEIFEIIRQTKPGKGGEIQITDALLTLAKQGKVLAYRFRGRRFDCGSVDGFVEATNFFYRNRV
jgi:UTP--glucose-1-phosphate uridylyltransferase